MNQSWSWLFNSSFADGGDSWVPDSKNTVVSAAIEGRKGASLKVSGNIFLRREHENAYEWGMIPEFIYCARSCPGEERRQQGGKWVYAYKPKSLGQGVGEGGGRHCCWLMRSLWPPPLFLWPPHQAFIPPLAEDLLVRDFERLGRLPYKAGLSLQRAQEGWFSLTGSELRAVFPEGPCEEPLQLRKLQELCAWT